MNNFAESLKFCKTIFYLDNVINVSNSHIKVAMPYYSHLFMKYFIFKCLMTDIKVYIFSQVYMLIQWALAPLKDLKD